MKGGNVEAVDALFDCGTDIDGYWHRTALMIAAKAEDTNMVKYLVNKGIRLDVLDVHGRTFYHKAYDELPIQSS